VKRPREMSPGNVPFILLVCAMLLQAGSLFGGDRSIAVVVSDRIKPYMQVLTGLEQGLDNEALEVFFLSSSDNQDRVGENLRNNKYDLFVAIGPEAGQLVWRMDTLGDRGKIFSAILDPASVLRPDDSGCGVSLQIPVYIQLREIAAALPEVKTLGLLFDREHNETFFQNARAFGEDQGLNVIAMPVDSKKEIPHILKQNLGRIDCVWMIPDQTVISEKIVQYVIQQALFDKKGVIGYNSFFIRSGALFAFEFDYTKIGKQTADRVNTYSKENGCSSVVPFFNKTINLKMAHTLGILVGELQK